MNENHDDYLIDSLKSSIKKIKKSKDPLSYYQVLENYVFDEEYDVKIVVSLLKKPSTEYLRGLRMFK